MTDSEKINEIYQKLVIEPQTKSENLKEVFGGDRIQPIQPKIETPLGFITIFGAEPDKFNSAQRAVWLNQLKKFDGLIPGFQQRLDYLPKSYVSQSKEYDLGYPIGYIFDGEERITFSNKPEFWRNISWFDDKNYMLLLDVARNSRT